MIKLTIGIPSLPERIRKYLEPKIAQLQSQIGSQKDVEIISLIDNRMASIGRKRTQLFNLAQGKYCTLSDDDDGLVDNYVEIMRNVINDNTDQDVICYNQLATINGRQWTIRTSLDHNKEHPFDQLAVDGNGNIVPCNRPPWHWCAWKTSFAKTIPFGDSNCHEDAIFVREAVKHAKTQIVLDKVLCLYNESQTPFNSALDINKIAPVKIG